jgi:hypothetical protein
VKRLLARCAVVVAVGVGIWVVWKGWELVQFCAAVAGNQSDQEWVESRSEAPDGKWIVEVVARSRGLNSVWLYVDLADHEGRYRRRLCRIDAGPFEPKWTSPNLLTLRAPEFWDIDRSHRSDYPQVEFVGLER